MEKSISLFIIGVIYIACIVALVRPGSKGPQLVENVLGMLTDLVRGTTGQTYNASTGQWSVS